MNMYQNLNKLFLTSFVLLSLFLIPCNAQVNNFRSSELTPDQFGIGKVAANVQSHYKSIGRLVLGTSYLAGIAFVVACLFKFKQHKDNPTQVTIGTPFTLLLIGIFMIFLPGLIKPVGETVFGHGVHATNSYSGRVLTSNLFDEDDDLLW